ncbi:sugar phosphate isomerase/epimerase family protein [Halorussus salinisoli]|uniref:sugar phosphate isomerase/epimerase family protein n=1 Tax=Halorussus salinisoli TaxID=2558242 RepID=UPI0010C173BC|nr:sugar phosphate isomerase/epimerase [Halorussus salinisoli]
MVRTAINLYSVRELDLAMTDLLDRVADASYDGVQFSGGLRGEDPDRVAEKLAERDLGITGAHVGIEQLEDDLADTIEIYRTLGCDSLVVPWLPASHFETREEAVTTADRIAALADRVTEYDFELHYHNHDQEFTDYGGETGFDVLLERTDDVLFELDVGWVAAGDSDPVATIERVRDRTSLIHLKDVAVASGTPVEIGDGDVDIPACAEAARKANMKWLIYEYDDPEDPLESIDFGAEFLSQL